MSKSLWSRSVWNSLFNRTSTRRLAKKRLNGQRANLKASTPMETLEERVVLAAEVVFDSSANALTVTDLDVTADAYSFTIKAGSDYTDILVNGKFQTRLTEVNSENIATITFAGGAGGGTETLSVSGVNGLNGEVTINLTDTENLLLNTKTTTVIATGTSTGLALGKSTVDGTLTMSGAGLGSVTQFGKVNVTGETSIDTGTAGDTITLSSSNSFGRLLLTGTSVNIREAGATDLGLVTTGGAGSLTVKSGGAITDSGTITAGSGGTTLTASGNEITLDEAASTFAGVLAAKGSNIQIDNNAATNLGNVTAAGTFTLTSAGAVTHTAGNVKVTDAATIATDTPASQDITITAGTNSFGSLVLSANDIAITQKGAMNLGTTKATGNLTMIAKGAITDSGTIDVDLDTTFTTTNKCDITLDDSTSTYGTAGGDTLALTGLNISVINNRATALEDVTAKGTFTLESAGAVTQPGTATVKGRATVTANNGAAAITMDDVANAFGSISLFCSTADIAEAGATDLFTSEFGAGGLELLSTGDVTDSGTLKVTGSTLITATGKNITLDTADSFFLDGLTLTGSNVAITNIVETDFDAVTATGNFTVTSDGDVTDTGNVLVTGRLTVTTLGDIVLNQSNTAASIALSGGGGDLGEVRFVDTAGGLDIVSVNSVGKLIVTTTGGALTDSGAITVADATTLAAGAGNNITLDTATNQFQDNVTITSGLTVTLVDNDGLGLGFGVSTISGNLILTADGDVTTNGNAVSVGTGATTITVNAGSTGSISLTNVTLPNNAITLTLTGVNGTLTPVAGSPAARTVDLGTTSLSGFLTLTEVNSVTDSGKLTIAGTVSITTDDNTVDDITLNSVGNTFGTLNLSADDITIVEAAATDLGTVTALGLTAGASEGTLTVTSSGAVTDSGTILVGIVDAGAGTALGATSITATGNNITLDSTANSFDGALTLTGANVTIKDDANTVLTSVTASGTFTLTTATAVTQTGNVIVTGLATITTGTTIDLDLDVSTINFGSLSLTGTDIDIVEDSATVLALVSGSTLNLLSAGSITDTGTLTLAGASSFQAGRGLNKLEAIILNDPSSTFNVLALDGGIVTLVENVAPLNLSTVLVNVANGLPGGNSTTVTNHADSTMTITSAGDVEHLGGTLTVLGRLSINANSGTGTVQLFGGTDNFESLSITASSATVDEDSATSLATTSITGAFNLTTAGNVTDSGVLTLGGLTTITTSAGGDITLDTANSSFSSIDLSGGDVTILAYSGLEIIDADATAGDLIIIASGGITDGGILRTISATSDVFIQAGLDTVTPARQLSPAVPADLALLNALDLAFSDPSFGAGATEIYVGSIVNHL